MSPQKEVATDDAYAACIDAHGGEARVLSGGGIVFVANPRTSGRLTAAQAACRKLLPKGGLPAPSDAQNARHLAQMLRLSRCMRAHGEPAFPDPSSSGGIQISPNSGIDPRSPRFQAAQKACAEDFPGGSPP